MNMGTRFIATKEAPVHDNVKEAIVRATELDTRLIMRPLRNTERVLNNAGVERLLAKERTLGADLKFEDIIPEVAGVYPRVMREGQVDAGRVELRHGRRVDPRHPDGEGAHRPHHVGSRDPRPQAPRGDPGLRRRRARRRLHATRDILG